MSIFMLASCFSFAALPPNRVHNVTQVEAEEKILDEFKNQDVNIFKKEEFLPSLILNGGAESSKWTFFCRSRTYERMDARCLYRRNS